MVKPDMRVEIWSDVVCPWCYIGKRRFEKALTQFPHAADVEVVYRSFELDPSTPKGSGQHIADYLGAKYGGGPAAGQQMVARVAEAAAGEGIDFHYGDAVRSNTADAHRLLHLALETGGPARQAALKERLLRAYFTDNQAVDDPEVLFAAATQVGLQAERVREVLAADAYTDAVRADVREGQALGATGVPFYVIDRVLAVSGAQPSELFGQALCQAWDQSHPALQAVSNGDESDSTAVCGPDGCAI